MAYIFDPIRNTFIDDEDKSLGNKLALLDPDLENAIRQIGEKFGPDTIKTLDQLPENKPEDVKLREEFNRFNRSYADGGMIGGGMIAGEDYGDRTGFANPVSTITPEVEDFIIKIRNKYKIGAEEISKRLALPVNPEKPLEGGLGINISRAPIGKRLTKLLKENKIQEIPYAERAAAINQRGEFYGKPASEKYLAIRKVRDIDRTTRFKDTGELKYNIPKWAKYKIDFKNPGAGGADVTNIPSKFQGVQYYKTKQAAENALKARNKLKLIEDVDPDEVRRSANKKKYDLVKEVSNNNIEDLLTKFKKGEPIEQAHRLSLNQVKATGKLYNVMNLGLDFDDPDFFEINNKYVKPYENKLKQLYTEQNNLYKKASKLDVIPSDLQKQIEFNNKKISTVVDLADGRIQGILLDEKTLKPKVAGVNYANVLGFGLYDKPVKELTDIDRANIGLIMQGQIDLEKKNVGNTAARLEQNKKFLKNVDVLATSGKILKGAGKVIKPLGYAFGLNALNTAIGQSKELGLDLNLADKIMAFDSGDAEVALNNARRRVDPEFAAQERAKDLAQMSDDFEEVALKKGGPVELSPMPRFNFSNGGAAGADDDFAKELEYYFLNEDAELPKATSYRETMNPVEALNDMIDPRNYPYYADLLVRSGLRVGEFGVRILPALGKLGSDLLTKPAFRVTGTKKTGYVQDYEDIPGTGVGLAEGLKLEGTGIFQDFLKNITPTSLEKKVGLDKLIEAEEQKQKDRRSTIAPKVLGETVALGAEVTAPIFPGLRLLRAFAADRKLPVDNVTKDIMEKEIDEALDARGIGRRDFMKVAGAGGAVMVAKMLGVNLAKAPKVVKEVVKTGDVAGKPAWFDALVNRVIAEGDDVTKQLATQDRQIVHKVKLNETDEVTIYRNLDDGQIDVVYDSPTNMGEESVNLTYKPGRMDETTGGKKPPDEFFAEETEPRYVGGPEDADIEFDGVGGGSSVKMLESDLTPLKEFAGEKITTKELLESIEKNKRIEAINTDTMEQAEFISGKYGDGPEPDIDDFID